MLLTRPLAMLLATLLALCVCGSVVEAQTVLGEWKLVEQSYGEGQANLIAEEAQQLRIIFVRQGAEIQGRIRTAGGDDPGLPWPRLVSDVARTVHVEEKRFSAKQDRVRARYRVDPSPGDDLVLIVTEEYSVVEGGAALVGTVRVEFERDGQDRGSYLLHRRFERAP